MAVEENKRVGIKKSSVAQNSPRNENSPKSRADWLKKSNSKRNTMNAVNTLLKSMTITGNDDDGQNENVGMTTTHTALKSIRPQGRMGTDPKGSGLKGSLFNPERGDGSSKNEANGSDLGEEHESKRNFIQPLPVKIQPSDPHSNKED